MNVAPPKAGPRARPTADMETANPFNVPRMRREEALLVNRMTTQGKAKITAKHFTICLALGD